MVRRELMNLAGVIPSCLEELLVKKYPDKYFLGKNRYRYAALCRKDMCPFCGAFFVL